MMELSQPGPRRVYCVQDTYPKWSNTTRIWYSAVTGKIAPKDVAADWAMERLPAQYQPVILEARQAYLGQEEDRLASRADQLEEFVHYVKGEITKVVGK